MGLSGLPFTLLLIAASVAASAILFHFGIYFFFLPIVFIPLIRLARRPARTLHQCPACGLESGGNFCPRCGTRI